jgi:cytochrome c
MRFSFLEKFGASLLICAWLIYGANFIGDALVSAPEHQAVAAVHGDAEPAEEKSEAAADEEGDFATLLASADAAAGEKVFKKCKSCHSVDQGGKNAVGPNLWNVVGGPKAAHEGFSYSGALSDLGGDWTYEDLNEFLTSPKAYAPGTKMSFAGLKKAEDRAEVVAYLREHGDNPPPLPAAEPKAEPAAATAPAEEKAAEEPKEVAAAEQAEEPKEAAPEQAGEQQAAAAEGDGGGDLSALLASADPADGEKVFKKCKACHTPEQGGPNRVGPNLWNVVGGPKAAHEGFSYSDAMKGLGGDWTYADLDAYLTKPKDFAPGTKMSFAGLKKPEDRAAVISYLRTLSDSPKPLP